MKKFACLALLFGLFFALLAPSVCPQDEPQGGALGPPSAAPLQPVQSLFGEGAKLYRRGRFGSAMTRFAAALEAGSDSLRPEQRVRVLRALGNCAYRRGKALEAVGWYSSALRLAPRDRELWANDELARSDAGLPPADRGDLSSAWHYFLHAHRPRDARLWALVGAVLVSIAMLIEVLLGGLAARIAVIACVLGALYLALPWMASLGPELSDPQLVLRASPLAVRSEPRADMPAVAHLDPGAIVSRLDALDGWTRIAGSELPSGWVPSGALFALKR